MATVEEAVGFIKRQIEIHEQRVTEHTLELARSWGAKDKRHAREAIEGYGMRLVALEWVLSLLEPKKEE